MKNLTFILVIAIVLTGGAVAVMSAPAHAQYGYNYPPPPGNPYAQPWVGPNTPWVYYNGDWFLNGLLYYFFGPQYGWGPYYAYPPIYIVRPYNWYEPKWRTWYQRNPHYWQNFQQAYPYWGGHREGQRYDQRFYEMHHHGQGAGWQKGFRGAAPKEPPQPGRRGPGPAQVAPPQGPRPAPARVAPPEGPKPGPARVAPPEGPKPGTKPGPARVAPPEGPRPAPARVAPPEGQKGGAAERKKAPEGKPEKAAPGEEKH